MLEIKNYTKPEMSAMFGTRNMENLKRKMQRYGIIFDVAGRGENAVFTIKEIEDPFKIYCITELDFDGRTDFKKALIFFYYFFNDIEFRTMPDEVKEYRMRDQKQDVSRQTIATYISKLDRKNLVDRNSSDFIYYFAYKHTQRITDKEEYLKAWHEHWDRLHEQGWDSYSSIMQMFADYGGVARKQAIPHWNAIYTNKAEEFNTLIIESLEKKINRQN